MLKKMIANKVGTAILLMCAYLLVFGFIKTYDTKNIAVSANLANGNIPTVVLDAGHGGIDSGCVSVNGAEEKDINLSILLKLRDMLKVSGYDVIVTRDSDRSIHDIGITGLGNQKKSDMENRLKIINSCDNAVFISIHQNQFTDPKYSGAQTFYYVENPESYELAETMREAFLRLQPANQRETKPVTNELYLLKNSKHPSVMVECGFLSNPDEASLLESDVYRSEVAFTIMTGICEYINSNIQY